MNTAYLLTGGNLGDRSGYLQQAKEQILQYCGTITKVSSIYETAAWGVTDQPSFFNQALAVSTVLAPEELMKRLLQIEENMGRKRIVKMGPRIIDLDILLIDDQVIATDLLTLPHPALPQRKFALLPLAEIAPTLIHPILHKTINELLQECNDKLDVQKKSTSGWV